MAIPDNEKLHLQVSVVGSFAAQGGQVQETFNILHYRRSVVLPTLDKAAFLLAFQTQVQASWLAAVSDDWTLTEYRCRVINDPDDMETILAVGLAGGIVAQSLPKGNSMVFSKHSATRGRWAMGRLYVCGIAESASDGDNLTAGQLVLNDALGVDLLTAISAAGNTFVPCIFSQQYSQIVTTPTDVIATDMIGITSQPIIGSTKSRRSRVS